MQPQYDAEGPQVADSPWPRLDGSQSRITASVERDERPASAEPVAQTEIELHKDGTSEISKIGLES